MTCENLPKKFRTHPNYVVTLPEKSNNTRTSHVTNLTR